jgi:phosphoglycolate phosphatase-like HAD superfamily hydrolase
MSHRANRVVFVIVFVSSETCVLIKKIFLLMSDLQAALKNLQPNFKFLVVVDSDGCAFDSMEIKHKECFIPNFIKHFGLQSVSKYARETAEFVNLYSKWRGANRFISYLVTLDLLKDRPEVMALNAKIPQILGLRNWVKRETKLGHPTLSAEVKKTGDPDLKRALDWSISVNKSVQEIAMHIPPFPFVRESLERVSQWADIMVCSVTRDDELVREWEGAQLAKYVSFIGGQEIGSKVEMIDMAISGGKYQKENAIMLGDAPGDKKAAEKNGIHFFPIKPSQEEMSWDFFYKEAAERFYLGRYAGDYESKLIAEFDALLPETPPWK